MTNQERRERRREAALKGARTRAAKPAADPDPPAPAELDGPTARQVVARAQSMGREADLYYHAHLARWPHRPSAWTAEQRTALDAFLDRFTRPDGTPQPVPLSRRKAR
jgi:hypothetical protein